MHEIDRRELIAGLAGAAALGCVLRGPGPEVERRRPNLLIVLPDELRASALGCMGNDLVQTPNIDGFAERGLLFSNATACAPVCSPCRAQIQTGKYSGDSAHPRIDGHLLYRLPYRETSLAEVLKELTR